MLTDHDHHLESGYQRMEAESAEYDAKLEMLMGELQSDDAALGETIQKHAKDLTALDLELIGAGLRLIDKTREGVADLIERLAQLDLA